MTGVLGYLAARSLRESRPAPGDEARPQPSVRPRLPSFYEATEEREPRRRAPIVIEEETVSSEQAAKPRAARTSAAILPESAHAIADAVAPRRSAAPSAPPLPPSQDNDTHAPRPRRLPDVSPPRIDETQERRSGDTIPTAPERSAPQASSRPVALDAEPAAVVAPRVVTPAPERQAPRSATTIDAASASPPSPVASPAPIRSRGDADADRPLRGVEARGQALVPKIDAPRETLRSPQRPAPEPPPATPRVQVTIGRIEIRAAYAPAPPAPASRPKPAMSLDDYLAKREQGRGGA